MPQLRHPLPRLKRETEGVLLILSCRCPLSPLASNAHRKKLSSSRQHICRGCPRLRLRPAHTHKVCDGYHSHLLTISALTALVSQRVSLAHDSHAHTLNTCAQLENPRPRHSPSLSCPQHRRPRCAPDTCACRMPRAPLTHKCTLDACASSVNVPPTYFHYVPLPSTCARCMPSLHQCAILNAPSVNVPLIT